MDALAIFCLLTSIIGPCAAAALPTPRIPFPAPGAAVVEHRHAAATGTFVTNTSSIATTASVTSAPVRQQADDCTPKTVCVDYLNDCGIRWGS